MPISEEQKRILAPVCRLACEALMDGRTIAEIERRISQETGDKAEIEYIMETAGLQNAKYNAFIKSNEVEFSRSVIFMGVGLLALLGLVILSVGIPSSGRNSGRLWLILLLGGGAVAYGVWTWLKAARSSK